MRASLIHRPGQRHQLTAMLAMQEGLQRHGIDTELLAEGDQPSGCFVVTWNCKRAFEEPQLVLEAGYINGQSGDYTSDRLQYISTGWDGLHGRAGSSPSGCPPDRWRALNIHLQDWHDALGFVLICDQHPGDVCAPPAGWWKDAEQTFPPPVVYRPHPLLAPEMRPLSSALHGARACITWSSTAAVQAIIAGVPTWALDRGSIAWEVCAHDLGDPARLCDRRQWAYDLAYRQWTHDELADGTAWEYLKSRMQ